MQAGPLSQVRPALTSGHLPLSNCYIAADPLAVRTGLGGAGP